METFITQLRQFNRSYLPAFHLLGNNYLGEAYNLTEVRILFEIYENAGCTASFISHSLQLDKGYISKILKRFQTSGFVMKKTSQIDGRQHSLFLTETGLTAVESYIDKANQQIAKQLGRLTAQQRSKFQQAIATLIPLIEEMEKKHED
ncbi:TPA: winged helix-turn-helix transcriptional regulator [Streptococcus suis]|uniref:MarR family winged helix-turn-helix transcriptional regulator n=1 Tax=Streptococcus suis TaxID=1307 RepID=UPI0004103301|nr:MarR family winged helix-turn-helix transcriptional regulator [Streptococcus suis]MCK3891376.1 winged helix-turn-helix transcriptional regulator [Streptococcus suis]QZT29453.1 MarR family winged helix-turn-helix transcriptional regulator [Streptococcus suis]HEM3165739.1 winged helix-turn-helix transcriptional regulator [Streptococcus suis 92-1191]HEM4597994.1 winged helix-turn-helix transcriptional regulator [Streptococcus suis]HEM6182848.1 winged helix-turn-helix transcriptional regulator 